ncbi:phosphoribosylamine--glycine ligase [Fretibacterium sp. OH1220_COT-178]|uniref:phosphoribosylamine--glycine ligase n=1 Tax=Fretibacterium sp. OH1220_COT-178 TaxID=2491047 RepID=UPI000F5EBB99|nr:phosphoribosylamine--glycine ligase [Fretibacterium sp. OH1220_COT-178]RRD64968.1 phosphoribosylamine--glycine ligase [Fretibacterium sp. OH1220_COT-178]
MNVMVVGGGGREHAIVEKLVRSPRIGSLCVLPGNGGIADLAECVPIPATDLDSIVAFAAERSIDFAVVAPDDPLVMGLVDRLEAVGVRCFGPNARAAAIEGSKAYAKDLMRRYGIPTARYEVFDDVDRALEYAASAKGPMVVKADGLARGKGVVVAEDAVQAGAAIVSIMRDRVFGASGERVVIEERLSGPEVSVLAFTDGRTIVPMVSSMDHKRAFDGDTGPNTGGMGAVAPNPYYAPEIADACMERIFRPTVEALRAEGRPFRGCLYFGLMLTEEGPKVIEYNCRFGDPEAQAVLPLLESDLFEILLAVSGERLAEADVRFADGASCCVVVASSGYPGPVRDGMEIYVGAGLPPETIVYHAGTRREGGRLRTAGGRVLSVTAVAPTAEEARARAYAAVGLIHFEGARFRNDIGMAGGSIHGS